MRKNNNAFNGFILEDEEQDDQFLSSKEVQKLSKDLRAASKTLSSQEARYLVDAYYSTQDGRKRYANQERAMEAAGEPHDLISWFTKQMTTMEKQIKISLDVYSYNHPVGSWMRANPGIGPVIAAGLIAHIDITKAPTVGHIWRYAGLDSSMKWHGRGIVDIIRAAKAAEKDDWSALIWLGKAIHMRVGSILVNAGLVEAEATIEEAQAAAYATRGSVESHKAVYHGDNVLAELVGPEKLAEAYKRLYPDLRLKSSWTKIAKSLARRPWNADLKVLCWKIGDSFRKLSNPDSAKKVSPYGLLYRARKAREVSKNDAGEFAEQALEIIKTRNIGKDKDAYWWYSGEWVHNPKFNPAVAAALELKKSELGDSHTDSEYLEMIEQELKPVLKPKLPPGHIDARAMRYAVKIFISHLHHAMYRRVLRQEPPNPYPIEHLGHVHMIEPFLLDEDVNAALEQKDNSVRM